MLILLCRRRVAVIVWTEGRWTKEEHNRFMEGLELFDKDWKLIANIVKTRTTVQVSQQYIHTCCEHFVACRYYNAYSCLTRTCD
jgi:Myb-like DNA-binding domain